MKWTDTMEIAESLDEKYPEVDIINLRYADFHSWIVNLEGFSDDPELSNEKILESIHVLWLELRGLN